MSFYFTQGDSPLLVSMPHVGCELPPEIEDILTESARELPDTDWYVDQLYNFLTDMGVSVLKARTSRYVIDLNRGGEALYPGQSETALCPVTSFGNLALYHDGQEPDAVEIQRRQQKYWQPYHDKLRTELDRIKAKYGYALLWDAHSIKSQVPRFFEGRLPDLNLGNGAGASCDKNLARALLNIAERSDYDAILNGRFKGGYITRHYGNPAHNIHSLQMEIAQVAYMDEAHIIFDNDKAEKLRPVLKKMIHQLLETFT